MVSAGGKLALARVKANDGLFHFAGGVEGVGLPAIGIGDAARDGCELRDSCGFGGVGEVSVELLEEVVENLVKVMLLFIGNHG